MVTMSWRNLHRLQPVHKHLSELNRLQQIRLALDEMLEPVLAGNAAIDPEKIQNIEDQINDVVVLNTYLDPDTPTRLSESRQELESIPQNPQAQLLASLAIIRAVLAAEYEAHDQLMGNVRRDTELEFKTATSTFIVLPLLAFGIMFLLRNKIFEPLNELATLMRLLARQDFKPAVASTVGPVLKPLFDNYNHMVSRLAKLEQQNRARQASLENQVRAATHALLEQQRELAAAERLAAVGELAAGLAHELRNPLAAMQVALNNLRQEIDNADHGERLAMVVNELNRVTALLNGLLSQAQQEPERSVEIKVDNAVNELATLARYQIGENIRLQQRIPQDLTCRLPAGRLHQALLNLVLNAAQAIGEAKGKIIIAAQSADNKLILSVRDDGPGFPPSMLHNGIRPFFSGRVGGTGLGLGIVQRFASDMGGDIQIANQHPHGATVTLTLPCEQRDV
jgi:C4-dicarboxylate-specific signal transduction histidine kinase